MRLLNKLMEMNNDLGANKKCIENFLYNLGEALSITPEINTIKIDGVNNLLYHDSDFSDLLKEFDIEYTLDYEKNVIELKERDINYEMKLIEMESRFDPVIGNEIVFIIDSLKKI